SSTLRRSSAEISPFSNLARASLIFGGRNRLPTSSARKGAFVLCMVLAPRIFQVFNAPRRPRRRGSVPVRRDRPSGRYSPHRERSRRAPISQRGRGALESFCDSAQQ